MDAIYVLHTREDGDFDLVELTPGPYSASEPTARVLITLTPAQVQAVVKDAPAAAEHKD